MYPTKQTTYEPQPTKRVLNAYANSEDSGKTQMCSLARIFADHTSTCNFLKLSKLSFSARALIHLSYISCELTDIIEPA